MALALPCHSSDRCPELSATDAALGPGGTLECRRGLDRLLRRTPSVELAAELETRKIAPGRMKSRAISDSIASIFAAVSIASVRASSLSGGGFR